MLSLSILLDIKILYFVRFSIKHFIFIIITVIRTVKLTPSPRLSRLFLISFYDLSLMNESCCQFRLGTSCMIPGNDLSKHEKKNRWDDYHLQVHQSRTGRLCNEVHVDVCEESKSWFGIEIRMSVVSKQRQREYDQKPIFIQDISIYQYTKVLWPNSLDTNLRSQNHRPGDLNYWENIKYHETITTSVTNRIIQRYCLIITGLFANQPTEFVVCK